eukprot:scaffold7676_cov258-Pinguiococcus_pyrenoidosus.AAC.5
MELRRSLAAKVKHAETTTEYPANLSVADLYYFWAAPTLSYQLDYPRTEKISLVSQIVVFSGLIIFISAQYILPHIKAAMPDFESGSIPVIVERVLRLSLSTTYVWLLGFYLVFHLFLNLLAELLSHARRITVDLPQGLATASSTRTGGTPPRWESIGACGISPCTIGWCATASSRAFVSGCRNPLPSFASSSSPPCSTSSWSACPSSAFAPGPF